MRRRQFVTSASATIAAASIAGCSGILGGGGGGGNSGPKGAVRAYIEAGISGDGEGINESIHPNATAGLAMSAAFMSELDDVNIQNVEILSESENEATVEVTVEATSDGEAQEGSSTYIVRKHEGEWKVYGIQS